jgi:hypothetical protein
MSSSEAPEIHATALVVAGPVLIAAGHQAGGEARCLALPTPAGSGRPVLLATSSPVDGGSSLTASMGARFAAEAAERALADAVKMWLEGAPNVGYLLDVARDALVKEWADRVREDDRLRRDRRGSGARSHEVDFGPYDATVAAAVVVNGKLLAIGVGHGSLAILDEAGLALHVAPEQELHPTLSQTVAERLVDGRPSGWVVPGWSRHKDVPVTTGGRLAVTTAAFAPPPCTLAVSLSGAGHLRRHDKPCQDSALAQHHNGLVLLSVADGHGDDRYTHADLGSRFATDAFREVVLRQLESIRDQLSSIREGRNDALAGEVGRRLAQAALLAWYARVRTYLRLNGVEDQFDPAMATFGTTLLGVLVWRDLVLCLRLGDGEVLVMDGQRKAHRVFPLPEKEFSNATESLSFVPDGRRSLADRVEVQVLRGRPRLVLVCSDGVSDSYFAGDKQAEAENRESLLARKWAAGPYETISAHGWKRWADELPALLNRVSITGTFDDVSVAAAWWPDPPAAPWPAPWEPGALKAGSDAGWSSWAETLPSVLFEWMKPEGRPTEVSLAIAALE